MSGSSSSGSMSAGGSMSGSISGGGSSGASGSAGGGGELLCVTARNDVISRVTVRQDVA